MISILMAVKTGWQFFPEALASVRAQEHVRWQLLIGLNGHPVGGEVHRFLLDAIGWDDHDIEVFLLTQCKNKPRVLNELLRLARGSHVAILDVDDVWHPWKLAKQVGYLRDQDVVGTMGEYFGTESGLIDVPCGPISFDDLLEKNCLLNSSVVIRREFAGWKDTEGLDDYPLWLELAEQGKKLMNIGGEPLVKIRCHPDQYFAGARDDSEAIRRRYGRN